MSIDGISTEFTESIRFVTTVHSQSIYFRTGTEWAQTNIDCSTAHVSVLSIRLWVGLCRVGSGGAGHGTSVHGRAGLARIG